MRNAAATASAADRGNCGRSHHQRQREALDGHAFTEHPTGEECTQMPGKMARSAPRPLSGLPEALVAVRTSRLPCRKAGNARIFTPVPGVIRRIPVKGAGYPGIRVAMMTIRLYRTKASARQIRPTTEKDWPSRCSGRWPATTPGLRRREEVAQLCGPECRPGTLYHRSQ